MAGDWMAVRENLVNVREVLAASRMTGMNKWEVAGRCIAFWDWAQRETADGRLVDVDVDALVDALASPKNFWHALVRVGWLALMSEKEQRAAGAPPEQCWSGILVPNFDTWLSGGAKSRLQKNRRQSTWRGKHKKEEQPVDAPVDGAASTDASTRVPYRTVPERDQNTHTRARDQVQNQGQGQGQKPQDEGEFLALTEDIQRDNRFINAGQRPLKHYPAVWLTPQELKRALEVAEQAGIKDKVLLFEKVQGKLKMKPALAPTINAYNWLTGWALQECLGTKKSTLDMQRSELYLAKAGEARP